MSGRVVRFSPTPNPNAGKFVLEGERVVEGSGRSYASADAAAENPLAAALFGIEGVVGVFMVADFVTVTKVADADWGTLTPRVMETIRQAF